MSDTPNNEPAFPIAGAVADHQFCGLSMRDYFAAKAIAPLIESAMSVAEAGDKDSSVRAFGTLGTAAYEIADLMLKARST